MVTLSVTRSRVADVLAGAADLVAMEGWDPDRDSSSLVAAIDLSIGLTPGKGTPDAEDTSLAAWDALTNNLGQDPRDWELKPGRTQAEVEAALRGAAAAVMAS